MSIGILKGKLPTGYDKAEDFKLVGDSFVVSNALTLIYAPQGSGKSYAIVNVIGQEKKAKIAAYLDFDVNSGSFKRHCHKNNIEYVRASNLYKDLSNNEVAVKIINMMPEESILVIDSFSSVLPDVDGKDFSVSKFMYYLADLAAKKKISIILIDHATKHLVDGRTVGFKIEGSESGKLKAVGLALKYEPNNIKEISKGGLFTVVRSRVDSVNIDNTFRIGAKKTLADAIEFIKSKVKSDITKSEFTTLTKHSRDKWVREFEADLFDVSMDGRTKVLTLKQSEDEKINDDME